MNELDKHAVHANFKQFGTLIQNRLSDGHVLPGLSEETHIAMLHNKIQRWVTTRDEDELIDLALDAFFAYNVVMCKAVAEAESNLLNQEIDKAVIGEEK